MFNKTYNVAATERANKELANSFVKYNVKLLDETVETFHLSTQARGLNLLDSVCDCIELLERDYFGIQYKHDDSQTWKWMKMDKLIRKQVKGDVTTKIFCLRMRFIPDDITQIQETYTRYQLFLQIKQDIYSNKINCSKDIAIQLAGYALQSELNDFNIAILKPGYVGEFRFIQEQTLSFEAEVANFHKTLRGIRPEDTEFKYLTTAKQLLQYGCDLYNCELIGKHTQFGFHALGISVFSPESQGSFIIPWNGLESVITKNKCFIIKVILTQPIYLLIEGGVSYSVQIAKKANLSMHDYGKSGFKLFLNTKDEAKEAWRSCIETHSFFRVRDPKQIQGSSALKRSHPFFKLMSIRTLFSGRRTLPELIDIKRRTKTLDRSFIRTPSKRYAKKYPTQFEKQSSGSIPDSIRQSGIVHGKTNKISIGTSSNKDKKERIKVNIKKDSENSDSESSDKETVEIVTKNFQHKSLVTQSVRLDKSYHSKEFSSLSTITSTIPRRHHNLYCKSLSIDDDKRNSSERNVNDFALKNNTRLKVNNMSPRPSSSIYEVKSQGLSKGPTYSRTRLSGSLSSMKNSLTKSNNTLDQSNDKLLDIDSCVEIAIKAQDNKYGFTIKGGSDSGNPVIICKISSGSAAALCVPNLFEGDQIIKINNILTDQLTNEEIKEIIRSTGQKKDNLLNLTVKSRLYIGDDSVDTENVASEEDDFSILTSSKLVTNDLKTEMKLLEESLKNGTAVLNFEKLYKQKKDFTMNEARKAENINKNRYKDILPYDQTRVPIRNNEYINACIIKFEIPKLSSNKYIATQGPLIHTSNDFWSMVWENKTQLIVMLTDLIEKGRPKCYNYWPSSGETTKMPNNLNISCESESINTIYVLREMKLKRPNESRKVTHLQYLNWPDHDVPQRMEDFISFMKIMRQLNTSKNDPILVHCSAGIGRTGVVITMDIAITHIELRQSFSVLPIVKEIRNQRAMLIQTQKQYEFVCRAIINFFSTNYKQ